MATWLVSDPESIPPIPELMAMLRVGTVWRDTDADLWQIEALPSGNGCRAHLISYDIDTDFEYESSLVELWIHHGPLVQVATSHG